MDGIFSPSSDHGFTFHSDVVESSISFAYPFSNDQVAADGHAFQDYVGNLDDSCSIHVVRIGSGFGVVGFDDIIDHGYRSCSGDVSFRVKFARITADIALGFHSGYRPFSPCRNGRSIAEAHSTSRFSNGKGSAHHHGRFFSGNLIKRPYGCSVTLDDAGCVGF